MSRASLCGYSSCRPSYAQMASAAGAVRAGYRTHGAGPFEIGLLVNEGGGKRGWSDTPFGRVAWMTV